jgi:hypothetical protein
VGVQRLASEFAVYKDFLQAATEDVMAQPRLEGRVSPDEMARVRAFSSAWRAAHGGTDADAFRALVRLGLDAAARPCSHDARWFEIEDRLERIEVLLDALGRAVSAMPSLAAWLLANAPATQFDAPSAEAMAEALEELLALDWDERCRRHGVPRPRAPLLRSEPVVFDVPPSREANAPGLRLKGTTVRLSPGDWERVAAHVARTQLTQQAALVGLIRSGLDAAEIETVRDDLARLLGRAHRIESQLDAIGPLATSGASVVVHLWRHLTGRPEEWEQVVLREAFAVAEATWHGLQEGPPQPVPGKLLLDPIDESEGDGWPT